MDLERDIPGMVEMARDRGERKVGSVDAIDEAQEAQEAKQIQDWRERNGSHLSPPLNQSPNTISIVVKRRRAANWELGIGN